MSGPLIAAKGVSVAFDGASVLSDVTLSVERGQAVTVIGPNGAGKTTLIRVLLGLLAPDGGTVEKAKGLRVGYMPQRVHVEPTLPLTVRRFLCMAHGKREAVEDALDEVKMPHIADKPLQTVSGGELQRVLLARALLRRPDLLVLDEPAQGVDVTGQADLYDLIGRIKARLNCGVLMVSHDLHLVMAATDRVVCLNTHVCCDGHPESVSQDPSYVALFGDRAAHTLAVYHHHHDHSHGPDGSVTAEGATEGHNHD